MFSTLPNKQDLLQAHERIRPFVHDTPVLTSSSLNKLTGAALFFKCENFQRTGSFKARGATNVVLQLNNAQKANGVATHSSGNHAQALALAARNAGTKATIIMPKNSPEVKQAAVKGYGADIILCEPTQEAREGKLQEFVEKTGAYFIPPYDHYGIIAGQASVSKELMASRPDLDCLITPVGGGGLLSGSALSVKFFGPKNLKVFGAEPELADDTYRSFKSSEYRPKYGGGTVADGIRVALGKKPFGIIAEHVHDIMTASETEIVEAMRLIWERMNIIIEASCAVPLAIVLKNKTAFKDQKIGIVLTGGNVDLKKIPF